MPLALRMLVVVPTAMFIAFGAVTAQAACDLGIKNLGHAVFRGHDGRGYEVFERDQHEEIVEFTVERKKGACSFFIGFGAGQSGLADGRRLSFAESVLSYQLYPSAGTREVLKDLPLARNDNLLTGSLSSSQTRVTFRLVFVIPLLQVVQPGAYRDTIVVRVYEGSVQSPRIRDEAKLQLSTNVPATTEFCLGTVINFDQGYRHTCVDFSELQKGQVRELSMRTRSNAGYRITMRSQNGGAMRIIDQTDPSAIPYSFAVDGRGLSLAGKNAIVATQAAGLTSAFGDEHRLRFTIGDIGDASAGFYQDVIVVTMYPNR